MPKRLLRLQIHYPCICCLMPIIAACHYEDVYLHSAWICARRQRRLQPEAAHIAGACASQHHEVAAAHVTDLHGMAPHQQQARLWQNCCLGLD